MTSEPYAPPTAPLSASREPRTAPRRWWIAGLLGLINPGLGQVYVGKAARGIGGYFLGLALILLCGALLMWGPSPRLALAFFVLPAGLFLYLWLDAVLAARRLGSGYRLKRYNRWYVYLACAILAQWMAPQIVGLWSTHFARSFQIPTASMEPTLLRGDHLYVDARQYRTGDPGRGDLAVFASPERPDVLMLSRVVGLPGDRLEIRNKELFLNEQRQPEPYVVHNDPKVYGDQESGPGRQRDQATVAVPPGHYFLLGDNRDASYDSRFYGPVERESILLGGRIVIYWSRDPETGTVRWERIGKIVE